MGELPSTPDARVEGLLSAHLPGSVGDLVSLPVSLQRPHATVGFAGRSPVLAASTAHPGLGRGRWPPIAGASWKRCASSPAHMTSAAELAISTCFERALLENAIGA